MTIQFEYFFSSNIGLDIDIYGYGTFCMLSMGFDCCLEEVCFTISKKMASGLEVRKYRLIYIMKVCNENYHKIL